MFPNPSSDAGQTIPLVLSIAAHVATRSLIRSLPHSRLTTVPSMRGIRAAPSAAGTSSIRPAESVRREDGVRAGSDGIPDEVRVDVRQHGLRSSHGGYPCKTGQPQTEQHRLG